MTVVAVDVSGLAGRAAGASIGPVGGRSPLGSVDRAADVGIDVSLDSAGGGMGDARSISEPAGLTFSPSGLSPGRTSRFVADL